MIKSVLLLSLSLLSFLYAQENFKYIQPVSVELASKDDVTQKESQIQKVKIIDTDGDGIADENDKCKNTPKEAEVKENGCELDDDNDGIVNSKDKCPETNHDFIVDGYGCPQTATIKVSFLPNNSKISLATIDELDKFADFLKENESYHAIIYGYTDTSGEEDDNIRLSHERAISVMKALVELGISEIRLTAIGRGPENPIAENDTYEGRVKNRRVEVELLY